MAESSVTIFLSDPKNHPFLERFPLRNRDLEGPKTVFFAPAARLKMGVFGQIWGSQKSRLPKTRGVY